MKPFPHKGAETIRRKQSRNASVWTGSSFALPAFLASLFLVIAAQAARAQAETAQGQGVFTDNFASDGSLNAALWTTQSNLLKQVAAVGEGGNQCFSLSNTLIQPILSFGSGGMGMSGTTGWQQFTGIQSLRTFSPPFEFRTTVTVTVANGNPFEIFFVSTDGREWFSVYGNVNPANQPYVGIKLGCDVFYGQPALNVPYTIDLTASASGLFSVSLSSGSATLAKSSVQVGAGPFYLILGQGEGWPNTPGTKNVAFWHSVMIANGRIAATAPTVTLYAPVANGLEVSLNGVATATTPGTTIKQIAWNWGDGSVQEIGWFPETHLYAQSGHYTIDVTATDSDGLAGSDQTTAQILADSCDDPFASSTAWHLAWSDEFNSQTVGQPNENTWHFDTGPGKKFGNGETEIYCGPAGDPNNSEPCPATFSRGTSNAYLDGEGHLVIQAIDTGGKWTSARMTTDTDPPTTVQHGVVEACMKLPDVNGIGPAFWMMGEGDSNNTSWPYIGEIDIVEHWRRVGIISGIDAAVHGGAVGRAKCEGLCAWRADLRDIGVNFHDFHVYGVEWLPQQVQFFVDNPNTPFATLKPSDLPKGTWKLDDWPFYLLLDVAVGGPHSIWGQPKKSASPAKMVVDYVRVYKEMSTSIEGSLNSPASVRTPPSHTITPGGISINPPAMRPPGSAARRSITVNVSAASVTQGDQFMVRGTVTGVSGRPMSGVRVQISASINGSTLPLTMATTAGDGSFSAVLNAPPVAGNVVIAATIEGTSPPIKATATLTVAAAQ